MGKEEEELGAGASGEAGETQETNKITRGRRRRRRRRKATTDPASAVTKPSNLQTYNTEMMPSAVHYSLLEEVGRMTTVFQGRRYATVMVDVISKKRQKGKMTSQQGQRAAFPLGAFGATHKSHFPAITRETLFPRSEPDVGPSVGVYKDHGTGLEKSLEKSQI
jgi:hypothetical protein